ncbi:MAG: rhomboid family intramembrane serine protease [Bacteroidota bacterium]|nr:rhomboid family intramembrane serine protease [Bacteroidota bacterium]
MNYNSRINDFILKFTKSNNIIYKLILINVIFFVIVGIVRLGFFLSTGETYSNGYLQFWNNLSLSADSSTTVTKPWTLITYMFMHSGFFHIFWNMVILYWFGSIFREYQNDEKVLSTYILGGLTGGIFYLIIYQFIPFLGDKAPLLGMVGASASVLAILVAAATLTPNYSINLLFIGAVKLKYIAIALIVIDIISFPEGNYGGHIAHLGGALYGFIFVRQLQKGKDIGSWINKLLFSIKEAFKSQKKTKFKTYKGNGKKEQSKPKSTARNIADQKEIDDILDKISQSGYDSLSEKEKERLFDASKK